MLIGVIGGFAATGVQQAAARPDDETLWERVIDPHALEVAEAYGHARMLYDAASQRSTHPDDEALRTRLLIDARGMLRYAHRLSPDHLAVLQLLAHVNDDVGRTREAAAAYHLYMTQAPRDQVSMDTCVRYSALLARQRRHREAIAHLRRCLDLPDRTSGEEARSQRVQAAILLANIYAHVGRMEPAIEVLLRQDRQMMFREAGLHFALAVAYDKDEQLTRAYDVLDKKLHALREESMVFAVVSRLSAQRFTPAVDRHYYFALLYEVMGLLPEARQEWLTYMRAGDDARFRNRAGKHIRDIDVLLQQRVGRKPKPEGGPPTPVRIHPPSVP